MDPKIKVAWNVMCPTLDLEFLKFNEIRSGDPVRLRVFTWVFLRQYHRVGLFQLNELNLLLIMEIRE